jgi:hypothetical protein
MHLRACGIAGVAAVLHVSSAAAHHSFAAFDAQREVVVHGTVKDFQWTNPHAWIMLSVEKSGRAEDWAKTLSPGMPVTVIVHPLRDGMEFIEMTFRDGTVIGRSSTPAQ